MRLSDIIKQCKDAGATSVELFPDGAVKSLVFGSIVAKKVLSPREQIEAEKEARNPRRDSLDLANDLLAENTQRKAPKRGKPT